MKSSKEVFFNKVKQFLDEKRCELVEARNHFLLISCKGQTIEIWLVDSIRNEPFERLKSDCIEQNISKNAPAT